MRLLFGQATALKKTALLAPTLRRTLCDCDMLSNVQLSPKSGFLILSKDCILFSSEKIDDSLQRKQTFSTQNKNWIHQPKILK